MAIGDKHTVLARSPLRHWGLERGETGQVEIGDGSDGTVTQADFDGRVEIGHAALVEGQGGKPRKRGAEPPAETAV